MTGKGKVLETAAFTFGTTKGEVSIRFLDSKDLSYFYEKKLIMFILEILSFVDFTGLDSSCTRVPLWGASQMWTFPFHLILFLLSQMIVIMSAFCIGGFSSYEAKDGDQILIDL